MAAGIGIQDPGPKALSIFATSEAGRRPKGPVEKAERMSEEGGGEERGNP